MSSSNPSAITHGPIVIGSRAPMRCASAPNRDESSSIRSVIGASDAPAAERGVVQRQLELQHDEEERRAERGVDRERGAVRAAELPVAEQAQREHRVRAALFEHDERGDGDQARGTRDQLAGADAVAALDQRPAQRGQPNGREERAQTVEREVGLRASIPARAGP